MHFYSLCHITIVFVLLVLFKLEVMFVVVFHAGQSLSIQVSKKGPSSSAQRFTSSGATLKFRALCSRRSHLEPALFHAIKKHSGSLLPKTLFLLRLRFFFLAFDAVVAAYQNKS
jgi:hypothetical protein